MKKIFIATVLFCLLSLTIGVFYINFLPVFPVVSDAKVYDEAALNLLEGKGIVSLEEEPDKLVYPGYPVFLAIIYKLFGHNYNAVRIIQFLINGLTAGLIYIIALKLGLNKIVSFLSGLLVVFWPYFIIHSTLIITESLFSFFVILSILLLEKAREKKDNKLIFLSGFSWGITALLKPQMLLFPFWLLGLFWIFKGLKASKNYLLLFLAFLLIISPWLIGKLIKLQEFISEIVLTFKSSWDNAYPEIEKQSDFSYLISSQIKNFFLFWNPGAEGLRAQDLIEKFPLINLLFLLYRILFFLILGLALFSLRYLKNETVFSFWVVISYFWAVHTLMYPTPRHAVPIIPLIIILAFLSFKNLFLKNSNHFSPTTS